MISAKLISELREITGAGIMDCKSALNETKGNVEAAVDFLREKGIAKAAKKSGRIAAEGLTDIFIKDNTAVILEINSETDFVSKNDEFIEMIKTIGNTALDSNITTAEELLKIKIDNTTIEELITAKTAKIGEKLSLRRLEKLIKNDNQVFGSYIHNAGRISVLTLLDNVNEEIARDVAMQAAAMRPEYLNIEDIPAERIENEKNILKEQAINEGKPADIAEKMVVGRLNKFYKEICLTKQTFIKDDSIDVETYVKNAGGSINKMIRYEVGEGLEKKSCDFASEVMQQINS